MIKWSEVQTPKSEADEQKENAQLTAIEYLKSTDWYAVTQLETGTPIPPDIQSMRAKARLVIFGT